MREEGAVVRNVGDTARWAAVFRARETEREDALFRDPYAARLAGSRGEQIAAAFPFHNEQAWSWVTRTWLFDHLISKEIATGTEIVMNLASGLDARPYRMKLPPTIAWVEVDFADVLHYKEQVLADAKPSCRVERVPLNLSNLAERRALFSNFGRAKKALVVTEGLLMYLTETACGELAQDLFASGCEHWILDIASPGLLKMLQQEGGSQLEKVGAPLQFAPQQGPQFFIRHGWTVQEVHSMLKTADRLGRVPQPLKPAAAAPEPPPDQMGDRPWSGVCLLKRAA